MELKEILEHLSNPDEVLDWKLLEGMIDHTTFWIMRLEQDISKLDFKTDHRLLELHKDGHSIAAAKVIMKSEKDWQEKRGLEIILKSLKSYRANIRKKRDRQFNLR